MYDLIQVGEKTYYVDCLSRMGLYKINDTDVCLIDTGNDKDAGKKLLKIIEGNGWRLAMILNTHHHADHIGGNALLQARTGCEIYAPGADRAFVRDPILEPALLWGAYPPKALRGKFLLAQPSPAKELTPEILPPGLSLLPLPGHTFSMAAIHTDDDVWFLGDSLTSPAVLEKYHVCVLYDVAGYLQSLDAVSKLRGRLFVPAHAQPVEAIAPLADVNRKKVLEIMDTLLEICENPVRTEDIVKAIFDRYDLTMDFTQYVLVGNTIRAYLSYLSDAGRVEARFEDNRLIWQRAEAAHD